MTRRGGWLLVSVVLVLACGGCAAGRFIVGAPAPGTVSRVNALVARRCSGCHEVPDPAAMTAADWKSGLDRMKKRMRLPASEWDSLAVLPTAEAKR